MSSSEGQAQLGVLGYNHIIHIASFDSESRNSAPSSVSITVKYIDGLTSIWKNLNASNFMMYIHPANYSINLSGQGPAVDAGSTRNAGASINSGSLSYDSSTGKLTVIQPWFYGQYNYGWGGEERFTSISCEIYYISSDLPISN